jgi:hypothetical protein
MLARAIPKADSLGMDLLVDRGRALAAKIAKKK